VPRWMRDTYLGAAVFTLFLVTTNPYEPSGDTVAVNFAGWRLAMFGDQNLTEFAGSPWIFPTEDGTHAAFRHAGPILVAAFFFRLLGSSGQVTTFPSIVAPAMVTALAVLVMLHVLERILPLRQALIATAIFTFATATWSVSADQMWTHGPAQLGCALSLLFLSRRQHLLAGLALGFAITMRPHLAVAALVMGIYLGWRYRKFGTVVLFGLGSACGVVVLVAFNYWVHGSISPVAPYEEMADARLGSAHYLYIDLPLNVLGNAVSPLRGILWVMPWLLLLAPGLRSAWKIAPPWIRAGGLGSLAYFVAQLLANYFTGGWGFYGNRLVLESLTLTAPLLVLCWTTWSSQTPARRIWFTALAGYAITTHTLAAILPWGPGYEPPWTTFLIVDAVRESPSTAIAVGVIGTIGTVAACRWVRSWQPQYSTQESTQDADLAQPGPMT